MKFLKKILGSADQKELKEVKEVKNLE
ncbi:MAG: hypothetical protein ACI9W1_002635, partial [Candidatus Azotimanducaceae bacterium]